MMTRCCRDSINLKSSVYNQTGQSYVDQLSLHRSMCGHLRRVLLAKSVVDSRNPRFVRAIHQRRGGGSRPASRCCRLRFLEGCPSDETIDRLAYDTEHHPSEIIRIQCRSKSSSNERSRSREGGQRSQRDGLGCQCGAATIKRPCTTAATKSCLRDCERGSRDYDRAASHQRGRTKDFNCDRQQCHRSKSATGGSRTCRGVVGSRQYKHYANNNDDYADEEEAEAEEEVRAGSRNTHGYTPREDRQLLLSSRSAKEQRDSQEEEEETGAMLDEQSLRKLAERGEEEARYAKFVYDITQEIVQNGLYTDRELKQVFQKHLQRNSKRLNRRKMLYEIYQLKISLNMLDDSEEDEAEADLVFAEKFKSVSRAPKPPTPPKVLNDNKIMEKLESFRQQEEQLPSRSARSTPGGRRSVLLVDANPEFLVTERDVLSTLADNRVEPQQIQQIYRNLFQRSKDMTLCEAVQVGSEVAYSHRLRQVDRSTSATSLGSAYCRERLHGILRKEATDFASKSLSPDACHRYSCVKDRHRSDALDKCARWKVGQCECEGECHNKESAETSEKEKKQSPEKKIDKEVKLEEKKFSGKKKKSLSNQKRAAKILENSKPQKTNRKKISLDAKSSSDSSEKFSSIRVVIEEKREAPSRADSSETHKSARSEENEEIEEEIESAIDEAPEEASSKRSSRKSSIDEHAADKSDHEEKEQSSIKERKSNNDDEEEEEDAASIASDISDINSSDISIGSIASEKVPAAAPSRITTTTSKSDQMKTSRFSSMKDYFERFGTREVDKQKLLRISDASSDSSSTSSDPLRNDEPPPAATFQRDSVAKIIRRRTSSGPNRYNGLDPGRDRLSSNLYIDSTASRHKHCQVDCRGAADPATGAVGKYCSDDCRFAGINCRNLVISTDCLGKARDNSENGVVSSSSTGSS